jgi:hypothetical protein
MTFGLSKRLFLRPEISFDAIAILGGIAVFNYGIAGGITF